MLKRRRIASFGLPASFSDSSVFHSETDGTAFAAIDLIASSIANLSGAFYGAVSRQKVSRHSLYWVLNNPNADETRFQFMYQSVRDYFKHGNIYWYKHDNAEGGITSLYRLEPAKVSVTLGADHRKLYAYGGSVYTADKILHIPSRFGYDGLEGKSIFSECRNVFKTANELDVYVKNVFNNNAGHRLIIDISKYLPDATIAQIEEVKRQFEANYTGLSNAGKPLFKTKGLDFSKIDTGDKDNRASQLLENRQYQEREIAKLFGIPHPLLSASGKSVDIESLYILFIENAIRPVATQIEQAINRLLPPYQRASMFYEYSYNSLLKTNLIARINAYVKQITNGILSVNEVRKKENLPEVEAGDINFVPSNLMPLRDDIVDAYMANAKKISLETQKQLNTDSPGIKGNHSPAGDDKRKITNYIETEE
ncbi:MAG: phage portal protein [Treponema sp.]|nr:phage portal protein [Treponema sp.]